jgi:hypothetical protein
MTNLFPLFLSLLLFLVIVPPSCQSFQIISRMSRIIGAPTRCLASIEDDDSDSSLQPSVICVGETLYNSLPDAIFLGGATTNVGVHLASMGTPTALVTCLGSDQLGNEATRRLKAKGVNT